MYRSQTRGALGGFWKFVLLDLKAWKKTQRTWRILEDNHPVGCFNRSQVFSTNRRPFSLVENMTNYVKSPSCHTPFNRKFPVN